MGFITFTSLCIGFKRASESDVNKQKFLNKYFSPFLFPSGSVLRLLYELLGVSCCYYPLWENCHLLSCSLDQTTSYITESFCKGENILLLTNGTSSHSSKQSQVVANNNKYLIFIITLSPHKVISNSHLLLSYKKMCKNFSPELLTICLQEMT